MDREVVEVLRIAAVERLQNSRKRGEAGDTWERQEVEAAQDVGGVDPIGLRRRCDALEYQGALPRVPGYVEREEREAQGEPPFPGLPESAG